MTRARQLQRQLYRRLAHACEQHHLLASGDRVMVAVSGGKDSYTLLDLLGQLVPRLPFSVELVAVHLDQRQPGYDGRPLVDYLTESGHRFEILSEDTYSVVTSRLDETSTYCSLCSRLRRGILYTAAERLGCNKIALGHHRDDSLETFLMNLMFSGRLQAMPARYTTDDGRFDVIRPLIECPEPLIAEYAGLRKFPILPCNLCGSQEGLKRDAMTALLDRLEEKNPNVRNIMFKALGNIKPTHMLDRDVLEAWEARPEHIRPAPPAPAPIEHTRAEPVRTERGPVDSPIRRLPLLESRRDPA